MIAGILETAGTDLSTTLKDELDRFTKGRPLAVIHIGASTVYKHWPSNRFTALAVGLRDQTGFAVALVGNRDDEEAGRCITEKAGDANMANFTGRLKLNETAALMKQASLFVGGDSGMAHLAIALGLRTVILFGSSDHLKWGTEDERHAIIRKSLPCSPCAIFGYHKPCRSIACMQGIEADEVLAACGQIMEPSLTGLIPAASSVHATIR